MHGRAFYTLRFRNGIISPEESQCCGTPAGVLSECEALIFNPSEIITGFQLQILKCSLCSKTIYYDGYLDGLINVDNNFLFSVELLYSLLDLKQRAGLPTNAWWNSKIEGYLKLWQYHSKIRMRRKLMGLSGGLLYI